MERLLRPGRILLLGLLALVVILPGAATAQSPGTGASKDEQPTFKPPADEQFVEGQLIVKFNPSASLPEEAAIRRQEGLEKKKDLGLIDAEVDKVQGQSVEQAVRGLEGRPNVQYAQPDFIARVTGYADEPRFSELWGLHNTGQTIQGSPSVADVDVNALEASAVTQGDPNLVVAVIDTGVDFSHPDLWGSRWVNPGESGGGKATNGIDDDGNGFVDDVNGADFVNNDGNPFDDSNHGTHVSGTIAGSVNDQGIVGVAPNVKIMALKFLSAEGGGSISGAIEAITYAKNKGAKISNNSWGGFPFNEALKEAIEESGSLFVAGAGNGGSDFIGDDNDVTPFYPASFDSPNILSVTAIDNQGTLGFFSNFGATSVDISAPGVNILSTFPGNSYAYALGTSMATPHAAGVAALAASVDPALLSDPVALKNHVMDTGKPLPATSGKSVTGDMVDAQAAVLDTTKPTVKNLSPAPDSTTTDRTPTISAKVSDNQTDLAKSNIKLLVDGQKQRTFSYSQATDLLSFTPASDLSVGPHTVKIVATDAAGNKKAKTWSFNVA
jgi:subtilisin family serine protease